MVIFCQNFVSKYRYAPGYNLKSIYKIYCLKIDTGWCDDVGVDLQTFLNGIHTVYKSDTIGSL